MKFSERYCMHHYPDDPVKSAVWDYVAGYTTSINNKLKSGRISQVKDVVELLDQAFVEKKVIDVWRTVEQDYLKHFYKVDLSDAQSILDFIGLHPVLTNKGYMSTASVRKSPWSQNWWDTELLMHITSDFPYPCIDINKVFRADEIDCADQHEILLPRNTSLQFIGYRYDKRNKIWVLEAKIMNKLNEQYVIESKNGDITCVKDLLDLKIISRPQYDDIHLMLKSFEKQIVEALGDGWLDDDDVYEMRFMPFTQINKQYGLDIDTKPYQSAFDEIQGIIDLDIERIIFNNIDMRNLKNQDDDIW